jgi:hypothetical protein
MFFMIYCLKSRRRDKLVKVVAALIWDKDKFMICQRPAHKARALLWEFVGGKVEPGETKEQALIGKLLAKLLHATDQSSPDPRNIGIGLCIQKCPTDSQRHHRIIRKGRSFREQRKDLALVAHIKFIRAADDIA